MYSKRNTETMYFYKITIFFLPIDKKAKNSNF